ncbi:amidohydrolase family protein [Rhodopseudomonas palustris]|uniref:metal-dependent hydrolase family protein n=1 Tax=Rhodopseudomonas palustris TaxID=1076 RepID=UPI002ACEC312|nr:amidohydrolase family protein [Rhodopseudomonas palustris]WQG99823.1 amidohydrolase family protein [Rhodopseudomonas palustris]
MLSAIVGGTLIDGLGGDPIKSGVVVIENGRIIAAGSADKVAIPSSAERLDASGRTILPGFIDCHVHGTYRARDMRQHLLNTPTYNVLRSIDIFRETLACGITTARDMGGADAGFRTAIEEGLIDGPRLLISLGMISQTGGHGDYWVPADMRIKKRAWLPDTVADGVEDIRRLVRELLMRGADFIKICATGGITSVTDSWDEPQFTIEEIRTAVEEAAAKRRRVAVHAEGIDGIRNAVKSGVHTLEHGWFLDEECADEMIKSDTWWVPTLALVPLSVKKRADDKSWAGHQMGQEDVKDKQIYDLMQDQIPIWKDAVRRGVKVAMGTDQSHRLLVGENMTELKFMVDWLGMAPMDVIVASTSKAAECIERPELGALAPGKIADVLVVDGDPLADIRVMEDRSRLHLVMKAGKAFTNKLSS